MQNLLGRMTKIGRILKQQIYGWNTSVRFLFPCAIWLLISACTFEYKRNI